MKAAEAIHHVAKLCFFSGTENVIPYVPLGSTAWKKVYQMKHQNNPKWILILLGALDVEFAGQYDQLMRFRLFLRILFLKSQIFGSETHSVNF